MARSLLAIIFLGYFSIVSCLTLFLSLNGLGSGLMRTILKSIHLHIPKHTGKAPAVGEEPYDLARVLRAIPTHFDDMSIARYYSPTGDDTMIRLVNYLNGKETSYLARELLPINSINPRWTSKNWLDILLQPGMKHIFDNVKICNSLWIPTFWELRYRRILIKKMLSDQLYMIQSKGFCSSLIASTDELGKLFGDAESGGVLWLLFDHLCVDKINMDGARLKPLLDHLLQLSQSNDLAFFRLASLRFYRLNLKATIDRYIASVQYKTKEQQHIMTITDFFCKDSKSLAHSYDQTKAHFLSLLEGIPSKEQAAMFELELLHLGLCQQIFDPSRVNEQIRQMFAKYSPKVAPPYLIKELR